MGATTDISQVMALLNGLSVGRMDQLQGQLEKARQGLLDLGQDELAARAEDALTSLRRGDLREFRRAIANVTAKLGHVK
ncbi:MAG: hypothetical protein AAF533_02550 [Acidobacteriota bacterium]